MSVENSTIWNTDFTHAPRNGTVLIKAEDWVSEGEYIGSMNEEFSAVCEYSDTDNVWRMENTPYCRIVSAIPLGWAEMPQ